MDFEIINTPSIGDTVRRSKIFGGWLVLVTSYVFHTDGNYNGIDWRTSVTFVFDPFHLWKIKEV